MKLHLLWYYFGREVSNGCGIFAIGGGKQEERGGKWGMRGREVGIERAGSGNRGGGKRGSSNPLSTPTSLKLVF